MHALNAQQPRIVYSKKNISQKTLSKKSMEVH